MLSKWNCSVVSDSLWSHGLQPARLLCSWDFPDEHTGVGCHFLLKIVVSYSRNPFLIPFTTPFSCWTSKAIKLLPWISLIALFSSVIQSCLTLCDLMNCSMPGLPIHHQLLEFAQTHIHRVSDAIQPSHPQSSPSPPAFSHSQHQGLFKWVSSLHQVAKVYK